MFAQWTGEFFGKMKINKVKQVDLAEKMGITPEYVSAVLSGKRNPKNAEIKFNQALNEIIDEKRI